MKKETRQGYLIISGVVFVFCGLFATKVFFDQQPKPNPQTNCLGVPDRDIVFLVDATDKFSTQTYDEVKSRIKQYVFDKKINGELYLKTNERVSIFVMNKDSNVKLKPLYFACKPKQERNALTQGKDVATTFNSNFLIPINEAIEKAITPQKDETSPIAHTINDLTLMEVMRGKKKRLVIYSDMMENTKQFSMFRESDCQNTIQPQIAYLKTLNGAIDRPDFTDTEIELNLFPVKQTPEILECRTSFWTWFFGKNPATRMEKFKFLPGSLLPTNSASPSTP